MATHLPPPPAKTDSEPKWLLNKTTTRASNNFRVISKHVPPLTGHHWSCFRSHCTSGHHKQPSPACIQKATKRRENKHTSWKHLALSSNAFSSLPKQGQLLYQQLPAYDHSCRREVPMYSKTQCLLLPSSKSLLSLYKTLQMNACQQTCMQGKVLPVICSKNMRPARGCHGIRLSPARFSAMNSALSFETQCSSSLGTWLCRRALREGAEVLNTYQGAHNRTEQRCMRKAARLCHGRRCHAHRQAGERSRTNGARWQALAVALCCSPKTCASS